jgi:hypothetical protein
MYAHGSTMAGVWLGRALCPAQHPRPPLPAWLGCARLHNLWHNVGKHNPSLAAVEWRRGVQARSHPRRVGFTAPPVWSGERTGEGQGPSRASTTDRGLLVRGPTTLANRISGRPYTTSPQRRDCPADEGLVAVDPSRVQLKIGTPAYTPAPVCGIAPRCGGPVASDRSRSQLNTRQYAACVPARSPWSGQQASPG